MCKDEFSQCFAETRYSMFRFKSHKLANLSINC